MATTGILYLIPTVLAEGTQDLVIPGHVRSVLKNLRHFLAEDARTARRAFSSMKIFESIDSLEIEILNKDTTTEQLPDLMKPLTAGIDLGIVSEAGCPGIADPGSMAVAYAHEKHIKVVPLVGPSSVLLGLMASGLNGQSFAFHGYLPVEEKLAAQSIKELEKESSVKGQTQIFIETPYRNNRILQNLLLYLKAETRLCVGIDLTSPAEKIISQPVSEWKRAKVELPKSPAIFLFLAQSKKFP